MKKELEKQINQIDVDVKKLKKSKKDIIDSILNDKTISIDDRYYIWTKYKKKIKLKYVPKKEDTPETYDYISNTCDTRHKEYDMVEFLEWIIEDIECGEEQGIDMSEYREKYDNIREEVISHNIGSFKFDW